MTFEENIERIRKSIAYEYGSEIISLGIGSNFKTKNSFYGWNILRTDVCDTFDISNGIDQGVCSGGFSGIFYFAPLDSDVARLNGHVPKIKLLSRKLSL